jgi:hypothetical protein
MDKICGDKKTIRQKKHLIQQGIYKIGGGRKYMSICNIT